MGRLGCTLDGNLNESKFSQPLPWIGIYIAAASAFCAAAMAADAFHGFRNRKLWFPCKFFSINAATLTLIAVATKLSVDLNTAMPQKQDQLAKLSSGVFLCTVMGNSLPSLGTMENKELMMNIVALGILVITAIVNICIQLGTGVIYVFWKEHALVMFLMLVLLALLSSSALTIPITKRYLDLKYTTKQKIAAKECIDEYEKCAVKKLRADLTKYWMMAHTGSPQFVIGRSATCIASGAFCLLSTVTLAEAMVRSYFMPWSFKFCIGESDYKWSTTLILMTQTVAIGVGTIAPAFRWFIAINFKCPKKSKKASKFEFKVEIYWIKTLIELKECPFPLRICGRHGRKLVYNTKNKIVDFFITMQKGIVFVSKVIHLVSIFFMGRVLFCLCWCKKVITLLKCNNGVASNESRSESQSSSNQHLSRFVLHLQGEEELVDLMVENNFDATDHWIRMGNKNQPKNLIQLLEKSASSQKFNGVTEFDSEQVPSLDTREPPSCWALPVVTLTGIAISLPNVDRHLIRQLIKSVHEGLTYVRLVENNLNANEDLINVKKAAEIVWLGVDLHHKWLDVDLQKISRQVKSPKEVLEELADIAKNRFMESKRDVFGFYKDMPSRWPMKLLAANSMYRISQNLLLHHGSRDYETCERLFDKLSDMISDILGACLTNLQRAISMECRRSTIEEREESVRHAVLLLGKSHKILQILAQQPLSSSDTNELVCIDEWRILGKEKNPPHLIYSSADTDIASASDELHLIID